MIQMHEDYLFFETSTGETIPCSAELVAIELVGGASCTLDPEIIRQAAYAVLHYFKYDLGRNCVSVADFSRALERVLVGLGVKVSPSSEEQPKHEICDLRQMTDPNGTLELAFFAHLRRELRTRLKRSPQLLLFEGLRACVKRMLGAKRWSCRCQELNDQIVEYLRQCLSSDARSSSCGLVVR